MITYKITNITDLLPKRQRYSNSTLSIEYIDCMTEKKHLLNPGKTFYLTLQTLPLQIKKLMIQKLVNVSEIPENQINSLINNNMKINHVDIVDNEQKKILITKKSVDVKTKSENIGDVNN